MTPRLKAGACPGPRLLRGVRREETRRRVPALRNEQGSEMYDHRDESKATKEQVEALVGQRGELRLTGLFVSDDESPLGSFVRFEVDERWGFASPSGRPFVVGGDLEMFQPRPSTAPATQFDPEELVEWAENYGHPEEWCKLAQDAHHRVEELEQENERLEAALARIATAVKALEGRS